MQVQAPSWLQDAVQFHTALLHPSGVVLHAASPSISKRSHLGLVSPDYLVDTVREERWVKVNQIDATVREHPQALQVVVAVDDPGVNHAISHFGLTPRVPAPESLPPPVNPDT